MYDNSDVTHMPRPLGELCLALLARVEALPAALDPVGGGQDADGGRVVRHEAADVVVGEAAVGVRGAAVEDAGPVLHAVAVEVGVVGARRPVVVAG